MKYVCMSNVQQIDKERHSPPFSFSLYNELCFVIVTCERKEKRIWSQKLR